MAISVLHEAASAIAELFFERILTVFEGRPDVEDRGAAYLRLEKHHPMCGTLLDRLVLGQQVGRLFASPELAPLFRNRIESCLAAAIDDSDNDNLSRRYLAGSDLRSDLIVPSRLQAAAALGAAISAVMENQQS